tara:strand:- start:44 stop:670 length:627 start_codon:yes stop_codon:yes gene_type:complete
MTEQGSIHLIFPTPFMTFKVKRHEEYKEKYIPFLLEEKRKNPNQKAKWSACDDTWTMFDVEKNITILDSQIRSKIDEYLAFITKSETKLDLYFDSWINIHTSNMYQDQHEHPGSIVSGIYYLQFDNEKDCAVKFINPTQYHIGCWSESMDDEHKIKNSFLDAATYPNKLNIKEGTFVLFPPYAAHSVPKSLIQHDEYRITYVFNAYLK